ncbi:hypothetical protein FACS1894122_14810 [Alphaproteobacteria bacterium]|nr:hypothetical protein FACS1894122_14810 [Alphaproteobacteria bacterium]
MALLEFILHFKYLVPSCPVPVPKMASNLLILLNGTEGLGGHAKNSIYVFFIFLRIEKNKGLSNEAFPKNTYIKETKG